MKRKLFFVIALLGLITGSTMLADANPGEPCCFEEGDVIYLCTGDDCLCSDNHVSCNGIKVKLMAKHPKELYL